MKTVATRVLLDDPGAALGRPHPVLVLGASVFTSSSFFTFEPLREVRRLAESSPVKLVSHASLGLFSRIQWREQPTSTPYRLVRVVSDPGRAEWGGMRETLCRLS